MIRSIKNKKYWLCCLLIGFSLFVQAQKRWSQSYTYRHYGVEEGLAQPQVFYSFQDSFGYIWFSANECISRFDGKNFKNYTIKDIPVVGRAAHINQYGNAVYFVGSNYILFIYPDGRNDVYRFPGNYGFLGQNLGVETSGDFIYIFNCYCKEASVTGNFSVITFDLKNRTFKRMENLNQRLARIFLSGDYIVSCSFNYFNLPDEYKSEIRIFKRQSDSLSLIKKFDMPDNCDFIKTSRHEWLMRKHHPADKKMELYACVVENDTLACRLLTSYSDNNSANWTVERLDDERFFFGSNHSVHSSYLLDKNQISALPVPMLFISHAMTDKDGNLWVSTEEGVYNLYNLKVETFSLDITHNDNIWSVGKDCSGNTWFGCYGLGFWKVDTQGILHEAQTYINGQKTTEKYSYMGGCEDGTGKLYLPDSKGIAVFDPKNGNTSRLDILETGTSLAAFYDTLTHSVFFGGVKDVINLNRIDSAGNLQTWPANNQYPVTIGRDAHQRLRIGTFGGEMFWDETTGKIVLDTAQHAYKGLISMALDSQNILWKGTTDGLFAEFPSGQDTLITDEDINFVLCYKNKYLIWGVHFKLSQKTTTFV